MVVRTDKQLYGTLGAGTSRAELQYREEVLVSDKGLSFKARAKRQPKTIMLTSATVSQKKETDEKPFA